MKKYTKDEIKAGSKFVPISEVAMNNWNPKIKRSEEFYKVKRSIELNGQVLPIIVRETSKEGFKYEILDGEQRYTALQDLGVDEVWVINLGQVPDNEAKSTTIWMEQIVPFDDDLLGELLVELKGEVELPYTDEEIELISGVIPETEEEKEEHTVSDIVKLKFDISKSDKIELKEEHKNIIREFVNIPENIHTTTINWAIIKLASMNESKDLLKQLIETKVKLNKETENNNESNDN